MPVAVRHGYDDGLVAILAEHGGREVDFVLTGARR